MRGLAALGIALALGACGSDEPDEARIPAGTEIADNGTVTIDQANAVGPQEPVAAGANTAFGLTAEELEEGLLVDAAGAPLAEIEGLATDAQGQANALVVSVTDGENAHEVRVPLSGLSRVPAGDHWNIRSPSLTRADLLGTAARRPR